MQISILMKLYRWQREHWKGEREQQEEREEREEQEVVVGLVVVRRAQKEVREWCWR
jgi:hypothetical protein